MRRAGARSRWRSSPRSSRSRRTAARRRWRRPRRARARRRRRAAAATSDVSGPRASAGSIAVAQLLEAAPARLRRRPPGRDLGHRRDDRVVPAEHLGGAGVLEPERVRDRRGRERPGQLAPQLGLAARRDRVDQPVGLLRDRRGEALAHGVEPERAARTGRGGACAPRPSSVSMLGPTTCPVEKRGSSTVNVSGSRITCMARSRRVTSQPSSAGSHETGSCSRRRASTGCGSASSSRERHRRAEGEGGGAHRAIVVLRAAAAP